MVVLFESLGGKLGLRNDVKVMGMSSMRFCCLFNTFQVACPFSNFQALQHLVTL
jgi:hypothetical protein